MATLEPPARRPARWLDARPRHRLPAPLAQYESGRVALDRARRAMAAGDRQLRRRMPCLHAEGGAGNRGCRGTATPARNGPACLKARSAMTSAVSGPATSTRPMRPSNTILSVEDQRALHLSGGAARAASSFRAGWAAAPTAYPSLTDGHDASCDPHRSAQVASSRRHSAARSATSGTPACWQRSFDRHVRRRRR